MKCSLSEAVEQTILFINDALQVSAHSQIFRFFKAENKELAEPAGPLSASLCLHSNPWKDRSVHFSLFLISCPIGADVHLLLRQRTSVPPGSPVPGLHTQL